MTYATLQPLIDRHGEQLLVQLTDRSQPPSGAIDTDIVNQALANTDAVIDGYLAGRYILPLAVVPPLLADLALAIAIYKLHVYSPEAKIGEDYKLAMAELAKIASGTIRLPVAGVEPASSGASGVETTDRERPLTAENLKGFI